MNPYQTLALFLVMVVMGWHIGEDSTPPAADADTIAPRPRPVRMTRTLPGPEGEAAKLMATLRAATTPDDRVRAAIELASTIPSSDFAAWIERDWFTQRDGMELTLFTNILKARWESEDPQGFLAWAIRQEDSDSATSLLTRWAENDPQRLIAFFRERRDDAKEIEILSRIAEHHSDLALRRFQEMLINNSPLRYGNHVDDLIEEFARHSPSALEGALDSLPPEIKSVAEPSLRRQRLVTSFSTEIRRLWNLPDGLEKFGEVFRNLPARLREETLDSFRSKIIDELPDMPIEWRNSITENTTCFFNKDNAEKWLALNLEDHGFNADQIFRIRYAALVRLSDASPESALKRMLAFDFPKQARENFIQHIFSRVDRGNPKQAAPLLALLTNAADRETVDQLYPPYEPVPEELIKSDTPADWLAIMTSDAENREQYVSMLDRWDADKLAAVTNQFESLPADKKLKAAQTIISRKSPLEGEALSYLLRQPPDDPPIDQDAPVSDGCVGSGDGLSRLAIDYIAGIAKNDPDAAGRWIASLPDDLPKFWAAKNLRVLWAQYDPEAAERWLRSLPAATQDGVKALKQM